MRHINDAEPPEKHPSRSKYWHLEIQFAQLHVLVVRDFAHAAGLGITVRLQLFQELGYLMAVCTILFPQILRFDHLCAPGTQFITHKMTTEPESYGFDGEAAV